MSDAAVRDAPAPTSSGPVGPPVRTRLRRWVRPALLVVGIALVIAVIAIASSTRTAYLDPDAATPAGGRALRVLLEGQGVEVVTVRTTDDAVAEAQRGTTLFVADSQQLTSWQLSRLADVEADIVATDVDDRVVAALSGGAVVPAGDDALPAVRDPGCDLPAATRAGRALSAGMTVRGSSSGPQPTLCYAHADGATLAQLPRTAEGTVTLVGSGRPFTNDELAAEGNAALGMNLLGAHPRLVWYVATTEVGAGGTSDVGSLLPGWVGPVVLQLVLVVLLAAYWRGRRLGPVVAEPLPVVVRAAEATEGRARLYRRGGARGRAAELLRSATRARLVPLVGAPAGAGRDQLVPLVAARTGRSGPEVADLLYGSAPPDDAALVRLADALDTLERTVRTR
jgi:hypothetical protein